MILRRLSSLPEAFVALRDASATEGHGMLNVLEQEWQARIECFDRAGSALFGAWRGDALCGIAGLTRDPYCADHGIGRVRRCYVHPGARRAGVGRMLVTAVIVASAAEGDRLLRLRAPAEAFAFYERLGFQRIADDHHATHHRAV